MKRDRLDEILLRSGLVNEDQIKQALMRQRSHGGRLGSHLLFYKFVTEGQLVGALSEQFGVPGVGLIGLQIPVDVLNRLPVKLVEEYQMLPFHVDPESHSLFVAMLDPDNAEALALARRASALLAVKPHVAAEVVLKNMIAAYYHGRNTDLRYDQVIELPDLFEEEGTGAAAEGQECPTPMGTPSETPQILMIAGATFLNNLLVSVFEREGLRLTVLSRVEDVAAALKVCAFNHILLSQDMEETFTRWILVGAIPTPRAEASVFKSVSDALLNSPVPYPRMATSLMRSLGHMLTYRLPANAWKPPYSLICNELQAVGRSLGLRRVALDGLQIAAHLLVPVEPAGNEKVRPTMVDPGVVSPANFDTSLEIARSLLFPWDVEGCLRTFLQLISGSGPLDQAEEDGEELSAASQVLALIWYRHCALRGLEGPPEKVLGVVKAVLRQQAGRLSSPAIVEAYVRLIEQAVRISKASGRYDVFIIGTLGDIPNQLAKHLSCSGYRIIELLDFSEAQRLYARQRPHIILIDYDSHPEQAIQFSRSIGKDSNTLLYAFTTVNQPSFIMHLLDSGFNDVFIPPFNYDLLVARIGKSLTILETLGSYAAGQQGFTCTFQQLPFVDLIQALGMSQRTVRVSLTRKTGERGDVYLREGQLVHASCDGTAGVEAVYKIIGWGEEGSFIMSSVEEFPPQNISLPNDLILLEGYRLLDEESS